MSLDSSSQPQVIDYFHAERLICAQLFVRSASDQIECSSSDEISGFRILHSPGPQEERGSQTKESQHHALAESLHNERGENYEVIGKRSFGVRESAAKRIFAKDYVAVGEQDPIALRLAGAAPHRVRFSQPPRRRFTHMYYAEFSG